MALSPRLMTDNWELKLTALGLAVLLWAGVRSETTSRYTMRNVPVEVQSTEREWVRIAPPAPQQVTVEFVGPVRDLVRLGFGKPKLVVPVEDVDDTLEIHRVQTSWVELDGRFENVSIDNVIPASVRLHFQPIETRMVPVAPRVAPAQFPPGLVLVGTPTAEPAQVQVRGPRNRVRALDSLDVVVRQVPSDPGLVTRRVLLDTAGLRLDVSPIEVDVSFVLVPMDSAVADTGRTVSRALRLRPR